MSSNCSIAVPLYRNFDSLSNNELLSLKNNISVLRNWPHVFFGPEYIDWDGYRTLFSESGIQFKVEIFGSHFFVAVAGYSNLLTSIEFYRRFREIEFILICQLDSFVFKDEVEYWCKKDFDFIGAPWFDGWKTGKSTEFIGVGNGGFSLRKVPTALKILKRTSRMKYYKSFWTKIKFQRLFPFDKLIKKNPLLRIDSSGDMNKLLLINSVNEDGFWTIVIASLFKDYKVAPVNDAVRFSFEVNPSFLFKMNNDQLPFGCHAWEKYEPEFWKNHIHA